MRMTTKLGPPAVRFARPGSTGTGFAVAVLCGPEPEPQPSATAHAAASEATTISARRLPGVAESAIGRAEKLANRPKGAIRRHPRVPRLGINHLGSTAAERGLETMDVKRIGVVG